MSGEARLTRRRFVGGCLTLVGLGMGLTGCRGRAELLAAGRRLSAGIEEREHWGVVGKAYLDGLHKAPSLEDLVANLTTSLGGPESSSMPLAERVRLDFEEGRTVRVDGWVIAETEARLAAVIAMVDG
jgi:hypothetical protein